MLRFFGYLAVCIVFGVVAGVLVAAFFTTADGGLLDRVARSWLVLLGGFLGALVSPIVWLSREARREDRTPTAR